MPSLADRRLAAELLARDLQALAGGAVLIRA
jgi:hypothetical protein